MKTSFKKYLFEVDQPNRKRPYIKASNSFKDNMDDLDVKTKVKVRAELLDFGKKIKSNGIIPGGFYGHVSKQPLTGYTEVHLDHGKWVLFFVLYRGSILYINLIYHKRLDSKSSSRMIKNVMDQVTRDLKLQVDKIFDK